MSLLLGMIVFPIYWEEKTLIVCFEVLFSLSWLLCFVPRLRAEELLSPIYWINFAGEESDFCLTQPFIMNICPCHSISSSPGCYFWKRSFSQLERTVWFYHSYEYVFWERPVHENSQIVYKTEVEFSLLTC